MNRAGKLLRELDFEMDWDVNSASPKAGKPTQDIPDGRQSRWGGYVAGGLSAAVVVAIIIVSLHPWGASNLVGSGDGSARTFSGRRPDGTLTLTLTSGAILPTAYVTATHRYFLAFSPSDSGWPLPPDFESASLLPQVGDSFSEGTVWNLEGNFQQITAYFRSRDGATGALPILDSRKVGLPTSRGTYTLTFVGTWEQGTAAFTATVVIG